MSEYEELVGNIGIEQWVRNKFVKKLVEFKESGNKDVDEFVNQFNHDILEEFKIEARKSVEKTLERASVLMENHK